MIVVMYICSIWYKRIGISCQKADTMGKHRPWYDVQVNYVVLSYDFVSMFLKTNILNVWTTSTYLVKRQHVCLSKGRRPETDAQRK